MPHMIVSASAKLFAKRLARNRVIIFMVCKL
jgi:hypothetical protein